MCIHLYRTRVTGSKVQWCTAKSAPSKLLSSASGSPSDHGWEHGNLSGRGEREQRAKRAAPLLATLGNAVSLHLMKSLPSSVVKREESLLNRLEFIKGV